MYKFAAYLARIGLKDLACLSAKVLSGFVADYAPRVAWPTLRNACGTLRVFVRYLYREGVLAKDLCVVRNTGFMAEARRIRQLSSLYHLHSESMIRAGAATGPLNDRRAASIGVHESRSHAAAR